MLVYVSVMNPEIRRAFVVQGAGTEIAGLISDHDVNESYFFEHFMTSPFYPCELSPNSKVFLALDSFAFMTDADSAEAREFLDGLCKQSAEAQPKLVSVDEFETVKEIPDTDNLDYIRKLHDHHCSFRATWSDEDK